MENYIKSTENYNQKLDQNISLSPGYLDDLEGIVNNEPPKNKYEIVKFHKLNMFPYFLIGKVVSKFDFDGVNKYLNGVGMLVGPDTVLTVAHNLCHLITNPSNNSQKILETKKVLFYAASNGDFSIFEPIKSVKIHIPEGYITALKSGNKEEQLYNDWGLIFLASPIGDYITNILDIEKSGNLKIEKGLYNFFGNNERLNLLKLSKQTKSEKISIVGYTEYKNNYRNNMAYKFLNNFTKKSVNDNSLNSPMTLNDKIGCNDLSKNLAHQGKIISELVKEKDIVNLSNDKKININININTQETEGLITTSRFYQQYQKMNNEVNNRVAINGIDYIILGDEEYNKEFDITDVDKLIMSESKGNLIGIDNIEQNESPEEKLLRAVRYQISTYKGQSGSPIFLRIKKMTEKGDKKNKNAYFYHFIGLHSRRGPIIGEQRFYESEKMNILTENLMTNDPKSVSTKNLGGYGNDNIIAKKSVKSGNDENKFLDNISKINAGNTTSSNDLQNENENCVNDINGISLTNEIIKQNGMCEYNVALSIIGDTIKKVKEAVDSTVTTNCTPKSNYDNYYNDGNNYYDQEGLYSDNIQGCPKKIESEFVLTKIYLNDVVKMNGLFKKNIQLSVLFNFGAKIFNVPKEYILLKDTYNYDFPPIHNYNFDSNKKLIEVMSDPETCEKMSFELMLNIKKYGEFLSNNIIQKFLENYDLEESQLKKDFDKHMKAMFHSIFAEINSFENVHPTYGKLFKKIRKTILSKLGLNKNKS